MKQNKIESYILDKINSGVWKINEQIPNEKLLINEVGLSKMTIRKTIEKLKEREILYSVQGKGVYVSPFYKNFIINDLGKIIGSQKTVILPTRTPFPENSLKYFQKIYHLNLKNFVSYIKLYIRNDKVIAYSINWVDNSSLFFKQAELYKLKEISIPKESISKIISIVKMELATETDQKFLLIDTNNYVPTKYSYNIQINQKILMFQIIKIHPRYFTSFELNK